MSFSCWFIVNSCQFFQLAHNARLRGWQRITTKLKRNNCNHRGSMGLETPRVDSPLEAFVMLRSYQRLRKLCDAHCLQFPHYHKPVHNI
ncbi:hypothetical protein FXE35_03715 [Vibrio cholerae]|nr:hypothetical protein FXE35_03715 [Vibrio cholerae]